MSREESSGISNEGPSPQALADLSHPERFKDLNNLVGFLCFVTIVLTFMAVEWRYRAPGFLDFLSVLWITLGFVGLGYLSRRWKFKPTLFPLFGVAGYSLSIALIYFFTLESWVEILLAVLLIPLWLIVVFWAGAVIVIILINLIKLRKEEMIKSSLVKIGLVCLPLILIPILFFIIPWPWTFEHLDLYLFFMTYLGLSLLVSILILVPLYNQWKETPYDPLDEFY